MTDRRRVILGVAFLLASSFSIEAQSFVEDINVVVDPYAELPNCKDEGIFQGETLETNCNDFCAPNTTASYDYADSDENPHFVIRNTVCRCFDLNPSPAAQTNVTYECWTKAEVWEKKTPIMKCDDLALNITSKSSCEAFCADIDPIAYAFTGQAGQARCSCSDVLVCDDIGAASALAMATSFGLLLGTVMLLF